jgi:hypothetical protein
MMTPADRSKNQLVYAKLIQPRLPFISSGFIIGYRVFMPTSYSPLSFEVLTESEQPKECIWKI